MEKKAIFFDVDGTLVSFKTHRVSVENREILKELRAKGHKVFIATGRMQNMLDDVLEGIEYDGYISYNGALCTDSTKESTIFKSVIPKEQLEALAERLKVDKFPVSFMGKHNMYVNYIDDKVKKVAEMVCLDLPLVKPVEEIIKEDIYQLCIYLDSERLDKVIAEVLPNCEYSRWIDVFADVNVKGLSKDTGIEKMLEHFNISLSNTMAFGDGGNDIPMLKYVAVGVAMGNAADHVKAAANYVTTSVDDNGIVNAVRHFNL